MGWKTREVVENPRTTAPGTSTPKTTLMNWNKYSHMRWSDTPMTNT
jgi:hypothetical protein